MNFFQRATLRIRRARLRRLVGSLGERSMIDCPDLITGAKGIFLDRRVRIWAHSRIECVRHNGTIGRIEIGEGTKVQMYFHCAAAQSVRIGKGVLIAGRVYISDHDHAWPSDRGDLVVAPVEIGDNCWLGEGCAILKGVALGANCIVGANAVVTKSAPSGSMLAGAPARVLKTLNPSTQAWEPLTRVE